MFVPKFPLGSEFIKFFKSSNLELEYKELVEKLVMYMARKYYKMSDLPPFHLSNGSTTDRGIKLLQILTIDIDTPSDVWLLQVYDNTPIPFVKFYISSSSRINPFSPVYILDLSMTNDFMSNDIADIAYGFDPSIEIKRKNRGLNIFKWWLPSLSIYGKEKWVYLNLKNIEKSQKQIPRLIDTNNSVFVSLLNLSEKIIKVEENAICEFLTKRDKLIMSNLGKERFNEILNYIGIDPTI